jgi:hypothetical protein
MTWMPLGIGSAPRTQNIERRSRPIALDDRERRRTPSRTRRNARTSRSPLRFPTHENAATAACAAGTGSSRRHPTPPTGADKGVRSSRARRSYRVCPTGLLGDRLVPDLIAAGEGTLSLLRAGAELETTEVLREIGGALEMPLLLHLSPGCTCSVRTRPETGRRVTSSVLLAERRGRLSCDRDLPQRDACPVFGSGKV